MDPMIRPTGPPARGIVGNFPMGRKDPLGLFQRWGREYGAIFYYRVLNRHIYFLNDPELVRQVLLVDYQNFIKGEALRFNRRIFGKGLLTNEGKDWLQQRRLIQPAFHHEKIEGYGRAMVAHAESVIEAWKDGEARDIYSEMMGLALDIVCEVLFDLDIEAERRRFAAAVNTVLELSSGARMLLPPLLRLLPTPGNMRFLLAVRQLDSIVYGIIQKRRANRQFGDDLLSALLEARDEDGSAMPAEQVRDEVMTLLLAGHETTAVTLSWTWYLLAQHPKVEEQLWAELREVLDGRRPGADDVPRLPYTERVIKEAMRLYPAIWALVRNPVKDCEIGGYCVPAGSTVVVSQYVMHRDARYYEDPERFDPDRWRGERVKAMPKFAYFPFGGGPRSCIGASFSMMEIVLVLATIAQKFQVRLAGDCKVEPMPTITLRPKNGIPVILVRRER